MHELPVTRMTSIEDCVKTHYTKFAGWAPITPSTCVFMKDHGKICKVGVEIKRWEAPLVQVFLCVFFLSW